MTTYRHGVPSTTTLDEFEAMNLPVTLGCATGKHDGCKTRRMTKAWKWADCECECHGEPAQVYAAPSPEVARIIARVNTRWRELHDECMRTGSWVLSHHQDGLQEALDIIAQELDLDPEVIA